MDSAPQELPKSPYGGRGPLLMGVIWSMSIVAMILMGLRTYTNAVVVKKFGWDYFWAAVTMVRRIDCLCTRARVAADEW